MKKSMVSSFAVLSLALAACTPAVPENPAAESGSSSESARTSVARSAAASAMSEQAVDAATRVIIVEVDNWSFAPNMITAKKGESVTLKLVGKAGAHSFAIPGLNINQAVAAGETVEVALPTDTAGTFAFSCRVPCGEGHKEMKGSVVIAE